VTLTIRPANLEGDAAAIVRLLAAHVNPQYDAARFDWAYRRNPDGRGRAWVAVEEPTGELVGVAGALPRRVHAGMEEQPAWVLADFCFAERYRALGPALRLQRACLEAAAGAGIAFCYDFPGVRMMPVYQRLHAKPLGHLRRLVRLLRIDDKLRALGVPSFLAAPLGAAGNLILSGGVGARDRSHRLEIGLQTGPCGEEFSALDGASLAAGVTRVRRSAAYLNWRFLANPFRAHEILTARRDGALAGYLVLARQESAQAIVDVSPSPRAVTAELVTAAVRLAHRRRASAIVATIIDFHPATAILAGLGFRPREASPVVVCASPGAVARLEHTAWFFTEGDRDG
jgi:GNAT superfamily N-acetyltransferase